MSPLFAICAVVIIATGTFAVSAVGLPEVAAAQGAEGCKTAVDRSDWRKRIRCECTFTHGQGSWKAHGGWVYTNTPAYSKCVFARYEREQPSSDGARRK